jgi:hypothetical protein
MHRTKIHNDRDVKKTAGELTDHLGDASGGAAVAAAPPASSSRCALAKANLSIAFWACSRAPTISAHVSCGHQRPTTDTLPIARSRHVPPACAGPRCSSECSVRRSRRVHDAASDCASSRSSPTLTSPREFSPTSASPPNRSPSPPHGLRHRPSTTSHDAGPRCRWTGRRPHLPAAPDTCTLRRAAHHAFCLRPRLQRRRAARRRDRRHQFPHRTPYPPSGLVCG